MKNSVDQGGCYPQSPRAEVDNTSRIQTIFPFLKEFRHFALCFSPHQTQDNLVPRNFRSMVQYSAVGCTFEVIDSIFGQQQLAMLNYACGFNQSEMGKYFE